MALRADRYDELVSDFAVVERHLPRIRRYARLCAGSPRQADDIVRAMLVAVSRDPTCLNWGRVRFSLLRLLVRISQSFEAGQFAPVAAGADSEGVDQLAHKLAELSWRERHAFLLVVVEEFTDEAAAELLDIDTGELCRCVDAARLRLA